MIKLIATDLDGTLVNDKGIINEEIFTIIRELDRKGIIFAAASGRLYSTLCRNFRQAPDNMVIVAHNGALVKYINGGKTIFKDTIQRKVAYEVIDLAKNENVEAFVSGRDCHYVVNPSKEILSAFNKPLDKAVVVNSFEEIKGDIYKVTFFQKEGASSLTADKFRNAFSDKLECVVSGHRWIDMMNKGVSKGQGIKMLQEKFDIKKEETMVFGDYYNDLPMFKRAHYSYAMENAPQDVKEHANFIAKSNNENGVVHVISQYIAQV